MKRIKCFINHIIQWYIDESSGYITTSIGFVYRLDIVRCKFCEKLLRRI